MEQAVKTIKPGHALRRKLIRPLSVISILMLFLSVFPSGVSGQLGGGHSVFLPAIMNGNGNTPITDLGSIKYTLDTARQATATYKNDGNPVTLSVTDAQGYVWTLTIPNGALLWPQKITMTPFASMDVSQSVAKVRSGVMIGPEGLRFTMAVTLSVTPPLANPGVGLIFSMQQDGSKVQFAPTTNSGKTASAQFFHFSPTGYDDGYDAGVDGIDVYKKWAEQEYKLAVDAANQFIKAGAPTPPTPPSVSQYCRGTEVNPENGEFYEYSHAFFEPYKDVAYVLLSAIRSLQLLGSSVDTSAGEQLAVQIADMAVQSILKLGTQYQGEQPPDRLMAIITTALEATRQYALLGGNSSPSPEITSWAVTVRDYYFDQLKNQHDYRGFPVIINLDRNVELLGGASILNQIVSAMTFEVIWDNTFTLAGGAGHVEQQADLKNLKMDPSRFLWYEAIDFNYTGGVFAGHALQLPLTFSTHLTMWNWDACVTKTVDLVVSDTFGALETYLATPPIVMGVAKGATASAYSQHLVMNPAGYMFTVPLQNKNSTLGNENYSGAGGSSGGSFTAQSHVQVKHTPQ